jgi:hypothetical protein
MTTQTLVQVSAVIGAHQGDVGASALMNGVVGALLMNGMTLKSCHALLSSMLLTSGASPIMKS